MTAPPFLGFAVAGPLARTVSDTAWLLSVMAGPDPRDPSSVPSDPSVFGAPLGRAFQGTRVAWCPDLGKLPLDPRVRAVLSAQRKTFEALGCVVEDAAPDLSGADSLFLTIRGFRSATLYAALLANRRDQLKPEAIGEIEAGLALKSTDVAQPAISVPAGFTSDGLPVGLQIVGRHRADLSVLEIGYAFEQATQFGKTRPSVV